MNSIEKVWKVFLTKAFDDGVWVVKDDGDKILELLDNHYFIPNVLDDVYCMTNISSDTFVDMIGKGVFNIDGYPIKDESLQGYVTQLTDDKQIYLDDDRGSFVYTYPERLFNIKQVTHDDEIVRVNQADVMINRLKEYHGSNRAVGTLYCSALDKDIKDIPCLNWCQCLIRDDKLSLHVMFRSNDLFSAFPANMMFLMYFGLRVTEALKDDYPLLEFKGVYYNSTSLHIYEGDYEQAQKVYSE